MSGHVADRLSPFLDQELTEAEAAEVRRHLGECEACARDLEDLRRVDQAFAAQAASAPDDYFAGFASRVRRRIEAAPPASSRGFHLPPWSWAVAAAILLGVLIPRRPWDVRPVAPAAPAARMEAPAADTLARTPDAGAGRANARPSSPPAFAQPAPSGTRADAAPAAKPAREALAATPPPPPPQTAPRPSGFDRPAEAETDRRSTALPRAEAEGRLQTAERSRTPGAPPAEAFAVPPAALEEQVAAGPPPAAAATGPSAAPPADAAAEAKALGAAGMAKRREPPLGPPPTATGGKEDVSLETEYETLLARRPRTAEDWRSLRTGWRTFLARQPEAARADEARVRVVEASWALWERTHEDGDREAARAFGRAYLERADALQRDRVKALLRRVDP